ncbi:MAG: dockerin type I domain-containing protein, partial [Planctomycetota bacterium]
ANLSGAVAIAANDFGVVGVSYIDADRNLRYGFKSGLDPWATVIVDQDVEGGTQPGLAYDAAGLPVISYVDSENNIIVAYDPVGSIAPAPVLLDGDANGDGVVDLLDFDVLAQNFGAGPGFPDGLSAGDFNADGVVDLLDFDILAQNFGSSSPAVVPVPGSVGLMGLGVAGLMRCRRP